MKKILIIGATSAIAEAYARRMAAQGAQLYLLARNGERLQALAADLRIRGAAAAGHAAFEAGDTNTHQTLIERAVTELDGLDIALVAHGSLGDQKAGERDAGAALAELQVNFTGTISLLTHLANILEARGAGALAVIGSVAGDRGRQSNYIYGAAKGGLAVFLQGLRNRLHRRGVQVLTVKPGFVDTPMTAAFDKGPLWSAPETIAAAIERGISRRKDVIYAPGWWRLIMCIIKAVPERLFKRLSL